MKAMDAMIEPRTVEIVGIGGGTGLPVLLAGLHRLAANRMPPEPDLTISAIVATSDDGGSSGRLRSALKLPAVGDLRNCVTAMADHESLRQLFQHRFLSDDGLHGHSLGNLMLAAMCQRSGSLAQAVDEARGLLGGGRGAILPVTEEQVSVCAELADGRVARGELAISAANQRISRVWLEPLRQQPAPGVLEAIASAKIVVLGPGSLYTSVIPNLIVSGVADAIRETMALRVFVCNLMTQPGETDGFTAVDHLRAIENHLGERVLDVCILNEQRPRPDTGGRYRATGSEPVAWERAEIAARGLVPLVADLQASHTEVVRHDPMKLARVIVSLATRSTPATGLGHLDTLPTVN